MSPVFAGGLASKPQTEMKIIRIPVQKMNRLVFLFQFFIDGGKSNKKSTKEAFGKNLFPPAIKPDDCFGKTKFPFSNKKVRISSNCSCGYLSNYDKSTFLGLSLRVFGFWVVVYVEILYIRAPFERKT